MTTTRVISEKMEPQITTEETIRTGNRREKLLENVPEELREAFRKALHSKETAIATRVVARLDLSDKKLTSETVTNFIIPFLNRYPPYGVVDLDVSYNRIDAVGAVALAANKTLTSLNFFVNFIGDIGAAALAANKTLTALYVSYNRINTAGLAALAINKTLTILYVGSNEIDDAGAAVLAANTTLTTLDVSKNKIGNVGAVALASNKTLTTLNISDNRISVVGAVALADNNTLTTLDVRSNQIGTAGRQALLNVASRRKREYLDSKRSFLMGCSRFSIPVQPHKGGAPTVRQAHLEKGSPILLLYNNDGENRLKGKIFDFIKPIPFNVDL